MLPPPNNSLTNLQKTAACLAVPRCCWRLRSWVSKPSLHAALFPVLVIHRCQAIATDSDGRFFIIARLDDGKALIHDPQSQRPEVLSFGELEARWTGELILIRSESSLAGDLARFDFSWFIPAIVKYRKLLGEVLLVSSCSIFSPCSRRFFSRW